MRVENEHFNSTSGTNCLHHLHARCTTEYNKYKFPMYTIFTVCLYSSEEVKCQQRKVNHSRDLYLHYRLNSMNKFTSVDNFNVLK